MPTEHPNPGQRPFESRATDAEYIGTDHLHADLKGRIVRGVMVSGVGQASRVVVNLAATIVLARLLTPTDFGLVAMVTAVTNFANLLRDGGMSLPIVQRKDLTGFQLSTLFWVSAAIGAGLTVVTALLSPALAWVYGEPRLVPITLALAGMFLFAGLGIAHRGLLRRQMRFGALTGIAVVADLVAFAAAVVVALLGLGAGYWSLVILSLLTGAGNALLPWLACRWRPGLAARHCGVGPMLRSGAHLTGSNLLNHSVRNLDNVLIGAVWGAVPLGLYTRAYQLLLAPRQQFNRPLTASAVPALSRLQTDPDRYRTFYLNGVTALAAVSMPVVGFLFVTVHDLIPVVLGPQWTGAVPLFRALAPAALFGSFNVVTVWLFLPLGLTSQKLRANFYGTILILAGLGVGVMWGAIGVALALSLTTVIKRLATVQYACRHAGFISMRDVGRALVGPTLAMIAVNGMVAAAQWLLADLAAAHRFALDVALFLVLYALVLVASRSGRRMIRIVLEALRNRDVGPDGIPRRRAVPDALRAVYLRFFTP